jgi:uncharacterized RDD family membrane protein YckC
MQRLRCPFCGDAEVDATRESYCSRCGYRLVGSLAEPYGWSPVGEAGPPPREEPGRSEGTAAVTLPSPEAASTAAGFWLRLAAWIIDMVVLAVAVLVFGSGLLAVSDLAVVIWWATPFAYFTICNKLGVTVGKAAFGLRIVSTRGRTISWLRAFSRSLFWLLGFASMGLGLAFIGWQKRKQGWHDMIAETEVLRLKAA